jgi:hypothetical protein
MSSPPHQRRSHILLHVQSFQSRLLWLGLGLGVRDRASNRLRVRVRENYICLFKAIAPFYPPNPDHNPNLYVGSGFEVTGPMKPTAPLLMLPGDQRFPKSTLMNFSVPQ